MSVSTRPPGVLGCAPRQPMPARAARQAAEAAEAAEGILRWEGGRFDVDSQAGRDAMAATLRSLHEVGQALKTEQGPMTYRDELSTRVCSTWLDGQWRYSLSIMTAIVQGAVYLNTEEHPLSDSAKALSHQVRVRVEEVCQLLHRLRESPVEVWTSGDEEELRVGLVEFDAAWVSFEERFFSELPSIEARARALLTEAMGLVQELDAIASSYDEDVEPAELLHDPNFGRQYELLIDCISRLGSVANPASARRSFAPKVLWDVEAVVTALLPQVEGSPAIASPDLVLACDAVRAWDDVCCYLYQISEVVDQFSPELSQNAQLVKLLAAWEASWALAESYVVDLEGRSALCRVVKSLREAMDMTPCLVGMLDNRSPELFMVLPRLLWLWYFEDPLLLGPLLALLLPHHFGDADGGGASGLEPYPDKELAALMGDYKQAWNSLVHVATAAKPQRGDVQVLVKGVLTNSAIGGVNDGFASLLQRALDNPDERKAQERCTSLFRKLERWSMELQRHRAKQWNSFTALVTRLVAHPVP